MKSNSTAVPAQEAEDEEELFAVLYKSMLYLLALYIGGDVICGKLLKVIPSLVGQIIIGMLLGPNGVDFVDDSFGWPLLGEIGLVILICQAGLQMDFKLLCHVGPRGALMALVGSILPTTIGFLLAYFALDLSIESSLALGCSFGPTSAGIALNVLQPCGVLKTALGQLIVAIAVVDDIIALVLLSQLQVLTSSTVSASAIAVPIVSALLWLLVGGTVALYVMPIILKQISLLEGNVISVKHSKRKIRTSTSDEDEEETSDCYDDTSILNTFHLAHVAVLLFVLLPATYYSKASHLLGAFLAGLSVCQQCNAAEKFNHELDKIIKWLIRIFFGASIAFNIPFKLFQDSIVIGRGFMLSLALLGKLITGGLLTPVNVKQKKPSCRRKYDPEHVRDCLVVGFSMSGEAEFAMFLARFGFSEGLLAEDVYASTVFAILLSTIVSPCLLRLTLALLPVKQGETNHGEANGADVDGAVIDEEEGQ